MFCFRGPGVLCGYRHAQVSRRLLAVRWFSNAKSYEPLRILFCGSDEFSIASLKALHGEHQRHPDRIASIDVVCRPGKRVGRGKKIIREVPIKKTATDLSLPVHEIDTFRGWTPPVLPEGPINLIVAVSFGLFVPPRILSTARYGGLNVHPSMLPDFYGPAPLHHVLLAGKTHTGVTLQTLHHEHFDRGVILQQSPQPGLKIPNPDSCTVPELLDLVSDKGAEILVDGIEKAVFVPPLEDARQNPAEKPKELIHATKITTEDRHIDWRTLPAQMIERKSRVIGPLWNMTIVPYDPASDKPAHERRVIITQITEVSPLDGSEKADFAAEPGRPFLASPTQEGKKKRAKEGIFVWTADKKQFRIDRIKVEGEPDVEAVRATRKAKFVGKNKEPDGSSNDFEFRAWYASLV